LTGATPKAIARGFECSLDEVRAALDEFASEMLRPRARARALVLDVAKLDELYMTFHAVAVDTKSVAARTLCAKLEERKATLPCLN
jgi:hypothetical protein